MVYITNNIYIYIYINREYVHVKLVIYMYIYIKLLVSTFCIIFLYVYIIICILLFWTYIYFFVDIIYCVEIFISSQIRPFSIPVRRVASYLFLQMFSWDRFFTDCSILLDSLTVSIMSSNCGRMLVFVFSSAYLFVLLIQMMSSIVPSLYASLTSFCINR